MNEAPPKPESNHRHNIHPLYVLLTTLLFTGHWLHAHKYFSPPTSTIPQITDGQVKHILQLATQQVTLNMAMKHNDTYHLMNIIPSEKILEYTAVVTLKFGYDLTDIRYKYEQETNTFRFLRLPPIKVLDVFMEIKQFNVFKSGWINSWTPAELTRVLGSKGLLPIKEEIKRRPDILRLALSGSSYINSYITGQLGMESEGSHESLDESSLDIIEERTLAMPSQQQK